VENRPLASCPRHPLRGYPSPPHGEGQTDRSAPTAPPSPPSLEGNRETDRSLARCPRPPSLEGAGAAQLSPGRREGEALRPGLDRLRARFRGAAIGHRILYCSRVGSTNDVARKELEAGA